MIPLGSNNRSPVARKIQANKRQGIYIYKFIF